MSSLEPKSATLIDGAAIAKYVDWNIAWLSWSYISLRIIRDEVAQIIAAKRAQFPRFHPHLVILQAGARPDSSVYVRMKAKAAAEAGIKFTHVQLDADVTVDQVIDEVTKLNRDDSVSGLLVQLPLGEDVGPEDERRVTEAVSPEKDVDGLAYHIPLLSPVLKLSTGLRFHAYNIGHLSSRASSPLFAPCTPAGCIRLIESTGVPIAGSHVVVLGRSDIVGSPVAAMLRKRDATVTQCHSRTKGVPEIVCISPSPWNILPIAVACFDSQIRNADIVVSAIGKAHFVKGEWIKPGAVVIDVGMNYIPGAYYPTARSSLYHQPFRGCFFWWDKIPPRRQVSALWATSISPPPQKLRGTLHPSREEWVPWLLHCWCTIPSRVPKGSGP
jgi:methylenetetrahydrofolate dehydrogenase (NADP+) / methenyltetrahydrofolate cyclohydrolase / formyltetrahydrofolate synthetase